MPPCQYSQIVKEGDQIYKYEIIELDEQDVPKYYHLADKVLPTTVNVYEQEVFIPQPIKKQRIVEKTVEVPNEIIIEKEVPRVVVNRKQRM